MIYRIKIISNSLHLNDFVNQFKNFFIINILENI